MSPRIKSVVFALLLIGWSAPAAELAAVRPGHPRLLALPEQWTQLRQRLTAEPDLAAYHQALIEAARQLLPQPVLRYQKTGRRLLHVSREAVHRVLLLAYAWQITGEDAFARRAEAEMLAVAAFPDWNPSHFLDVGEATAALAIGYDWLFDRLTPAARTTIRGAIVRLGLQPGLDPKKNSWQRTENNWNQVCLGGLTLGALAVAETEPQTSAAVLQLARAGIHHGLAPYAPDGVYPEGPSYWAYGTSYQVLMIAALESALGSDWDLAAAPGFLPSAGTFLQTTGPSGRHYNYADGGEGAAFEPVVFWFARRLHDPGLLQFEWSHLQSPADIRHAVARNRFAPLAALWWPPAGSATATAALPLRWHGGGRNPIAVFRSSWTDPAALYLACKGGAAELNHAHMDAGSFVLEANGVRWALDLGMQEYESLESKHIDLWNKTQASQRWSVYRLSNFSHNTLTIGGQLHRVDGHATFEDFSAEAADAHATVDLSPVFAGQARSVRRTFRILPDHVVQVQDELSGVAPGTAIRWQMATRADVTLQGATATLRQEGRTLTVRLVSSVAAVFAVQPADPPADNFNAANPGVRILSLTAPAPANSTLTLTIELVPHD
ncbi:MAG: heparinase II/III family protein [Opitutae bacterium]